MLENKKIKTALASEGYTLEPVQEDPGWRNPHLYIITKNGLYGVGALRVSGAPTLLELIPCKYDNIFTLDRFCRDLHLILSKNGRLGLCSIRYDDEAPDQLSAFDVEYMTECEYDRIEETTFGFLMYCRNDTLYFIDSTKRWTDLHRNWRHYFPYFITKQDDHTYIVDEYNGAITEAPHGVICLDYAGSDWFVDVATHEFFRFHSGMCERYTGSKCLFTLEVHRDHAFSAPGEKDYLIVEESGGVGVLGSEGEVVVPAEYEEIVPVLRFCAKKNGKRRYFDLPINDPWEEMNRLEAMDEAFMKKKEKRYGEQTV